MSNLVYLFMYKVTMVSKSKEFSDVQLRVNEKRILNTLNKDKNRTTIRLEKYVVTFCSM